MKATQAPAIRLGRLSPLRDWMRHPVARVRLQPAISTLQRQFFGREFELAGEGGGEGAFVADMPITKLVMFGLLSEQELAWLIDAAQTRTDVPAA